MVEVRGPGRDPHARDRSPRPRPVVAGDARGPRRGRLPRACERRVAAELGTSELTGATTFEVAEPDADGGWHRPGRTRSAASSTSARARTRTRTCSTRASRSSGSPADAARTWRARRVTTVTDGVPAELVPDPGRPGVLYLALKEHRDRADVPGPGAAQRRRRPHLDLAPGARHQACATSRSPPAASVLAAATARGLYAGDAGGASWEQVAGPWTSVAATELVGDRALRRDRPGLFVIDGFASGGRTPRRIDPSGGSRYEMVTGNARLLVASTGFDVRGSTDGGRTWDKLFSAAAGRADLVAVGRRARRLRRHVPGILGRRPRRHALATPERPLPEHVGRRRARAPVRRRAARRVAGGPACSRPPTGRAPTSASACRPCR